MSYIQKAQKRLLQSVFWDDFHHIISAASIGLQHNILDRS